MESHGVLPSRGLVFQLVCRFHRYWAYSSKSTVQPKMETCFQERACSVCFLLQGGRDDWASQVCLLTGFLCHTAKAEFQRNKSQYTKIMLADILLTKSNSMSSSRIKVGEEAGGNLYLHESTGAGGGSRGDQQGHNLPVILC